MFFNKKKRLSNNQAANGFKGANGDGDFTAALAIFSLAHTELIALNAMLKVKEIAANAAELSSATESMASATEEISASVEEINSSMQQVNAQTEQSVQQINKLDDLGAQSELMLKDMTQNVDELSSQVTKIDDITQTVSDIADQTNLLALNAAIEAARAGEAGRGFTVVADEVRKLAGKTKDSVSSVQQISEQINAKSKSTKANISEVQSTFLQYLESTKEVDDKIKQTTTKVGDCTLMIENITAAVQQQNAASENLARISKDLTKNSESVSAILSHNADYLLEIVTPQLKLSDSESVSSVLAARLVEHAHFLRKAAEQAGKGGSLVSYNECDFGKWYRDNAERYRDIPAFVEIDEPHRLVHEYADALTKELSSENVENLMKASTDILKAFIKLHQEVS